MAKASDLFRINLVSGNPIEILLAKFLKICDGSGKAKVIQALYAHYYSIGLSLLKATPDEIELGAIDSIAKLRNQISYIENYHRLHDGIYLTDRADVNGLPKTSPSVETALTPIVLPVAGRREVGTVTEDSEAGINQTFDLTIFDE